MTSMSLLVWLGHIHCQGCDAFAVMQQVFSVSTIEWNTESCVSSGDYLSKTCQFNTKQPWREYIEMAYWKLTSVTCLKPIAKANSHIKMSWTQMTTWQTWSLHLIINLITFSFSVNLPLMIRSVPRLAMKAAYLQEICLNMRSELEEKHDCHTELSVWA